MAYVKDGSRITKPRYKYPFKFEHLTTFRSGQIIPVYADSYVSPGTTFDLNFDMLLRALPLTRPPMGDLVAEVSAFFVPHRIVWNQFKEHWGENNTTAWTGNYNIERPKLDWSGVGASQQDLSSPAGFSILSDIIAMEGLDSTTSVPPHPLGEYFGYPMGTGSSPAAYDMTSSSRVEALKTRAYLSVYNEFFRSENLQDPVLYSKDTLAVDLVSNAALHSCPLYINKVQDVMTGVLPNVQKGPAVPLAVGGYAPVYASSTMNMSNLGVSTIPVSGDSIASLVWSQTSNSAKTAQRVGNLSGGKNSDAGTYGQSSVGTTGDAVTPVNLIANLSNAYGASVTDFRSSVVIQHYYETLAQFGSKYYEIDDAIFGVRPSNAREDLPELIGTYTLPINIQAVTSTAGTSTQQLGFQGAKSETYRSIASGFTYTTKEHGTILITIAIRQAHHVYSNRAERGFFDFDLFSETNPLFSGTSDVEVHKGEVGGGWDNVNDLEDEGFTDTLGYQEYGWSEKFPVSIATANLNPLMANALSDYTMADAYTTVPTLSGSFVMENPNFIGRAFIDQSDLADQFVGQFLVTGSVTRVLPPKTVPGLTRI